MSRQYLTDAEWRAMFLAQGCKCCVPGCESAGPFEAEHSLPNAIKPGKPDQIMCVEHHRAKTRIDRKDIARAKRLAGDTETQHARRERLKAEGKHRPIGGRAFQSTKRRTAAEIMGNG